jgi:hypothetical protein
MSKGGSGHLCCTNCLHFWTIHCLSVLAMCYYTDPAQGIRTISHRNCTLRSVIIYLVWLHYVVHDASFILTYAWLLTRWEHMSSTIVLHLCRFDALSQFFTRYVPSVFFRFHNSLLGVSLASYSSVPGRFLQIACLVNLDNCFLSVCPIW